MSRHRWSSDAKHQLQTEALVSLARDPEIASLFTRYNWIRYVFPKMMESHPGQLASIWSFTEAALRTESMKRQKATAENTLIFAEAIRSGRISIVQYPNCYPIELVEGWLDEQRARYVPPVRNTLARIFAEAVTMYSGLVKQRRNRDDYLQRRGVIRQFPDTLEGISEEWRERFPPRWGKLSDGRWMFGVMSTDSRSREHVLISRWRKAMDQRSQHWMKEKLRVRVREERARRKGKVFKAKFSSERKAKLHALNLLIYADSRSMGTVVLGDDDIMSSESSEDGDEDAALPTLDVHQEQRSRYLLEVTGAMRAVHEAMIRLAPYVMLSHETESVDNTDSERSDSESEKTPSAYQSYQLLVRWSKGTEIEDLEQIVIRFKPDVSEEDVNAVVDAFSLISDMGDQEFRFDSRVISQEYSQLRDEAIRMIRNIPGFTSMESLDSV
jgi:hypothetical protein